MLYVFLVNTGSLLTLDMSLTMESVQNLSIALEKDYQVHRDKQVLMISGGQSLDPKMRVGSYCAGTDTNPIFLFSKEAIEAANPPSSPGVEEADKLRLQVEGLKSMPPSMNAVVSRTQLALQFHDIAKEKLRVCEQLVHDQHLQQQGWMAVIANLEDITSAFRQRSEHFRQNMTEFLAERPVLQMRLSQFTDTLSLLEKVPLLSKLVPTSEEEITLMQWISHQDQKSTLMQMGHQCQKAVDQFSDQILEGLDKECAKCLDAAEKPSMKEIKGLGERLFGLGQLVANAKGILTNQAEMAQGLVQNQTRVTNINDSSVLPDLCVSHQRQLDVMLQKHLQLLEICRMCRVAKDELCKNLHVRLRWVMYIEQQISATHGKMVVYHENLKRLRKRLEIVRQVVTAPELYASSLVEILRRKAYNQQFIEWAGLISSESKTVHHEEISRRKSIASQLQHHFLSSLFPGMEVLPPVFVTNEVAPYEQSMPPITKDDITKLAQQVPELAHLLKVHQSLYYTTSVNGEVCVKPLALQESETQTSSPPAEEPVGHAAVAAAAKETAPCEEDDDDIDIYTAGDESDNTEEKKEQETAKEVDATDDFEEVAGELKGDDAHEALEDGRLVSNESDILETVSSPTDLKEFLSFRPSMDNLCLASFTNNEPFYSAISTPMEGNVPFLSTRQEDLQANHQDLEGKIESLRKKLGDMELTNSVLASKKTELEKKSQESSAHADKLLRDYEIEQERTHDLRNILQMLNQTTLKHSNTFRLQLSEVKTDFQKVQADTMEVLKEHYSKLPNMFSVLMEKETVRLQEKFSSVESSHVEEKEHLERELLQSQDISKKLSSDLDALKLTLAEKETLLNDINQKYESTQIEKETLGEEVQRLEEACQKDLEDYSKRITELENALLQKDKDFEVHKVESQNQLDTLSKESEEKLNRTASALKMESEMEIQDMEEKLKQKDVEIEEMQKKMEKELADGLHRIENEKVEALASLKREIEREEGEKRETEIKRMQMEHVREFEELERSRQMQLEDACSKLREEMIEEKEKELEEMREVLRKESSEKIIMLQSESESELDRVKKEYEDRLMGLEMELAESKRYEATPVDLSTDVMEGSIETKGHMTDSDISDMLEKERQKHAEEVKELREMFEQQNKHAVEATRREYELKMERIRQSMKPSDMSKLSSAEKQVAFNEAISRIAAEKGMEIRRLKEREDALLEEQSILQDKLEALLTSNTDLSAEAQDLIKRSREAERNAKYELKEMEETVKGLQQTLSQVRSGSPAELLVSSEDGSLQVPEASSKLHALLSSKEQECISLKKQLQMHMRNTHIGSKSDKITVRDIGIGDLVLITFEEAHQNFVVFTFEPTLYFVHSESLHVMGLKQDDAKAKREFTLAKIVDREYCQARKAQNRFRVPLGTKFYRVRVTAVDSKSMQPI